MVKQEKYAEIQSTDDWQVLIDLNRKPNEIGKAVSEYVSSKLVDHRDARWKLIRWSFRVTGRRSENIREQGDFKSLQELWDGIRMLPYENADLANGIGNCVALQLWRLEIGERGIDPWLEAASACFGDAMEVEFGADDGSYSRGYVSRSGLLEAVRTDIVAFLHPHYRDRLIGNPTGLLQAVRAPDRLFEFDRLARLFATQIAPTQVLIRDTAIFFSPARVTAFGLP